MKESLSKISGWFKFLRIHKVNYIKSGIRPAHDWYIILMTTFILIGITGVVAYAFYIKIDRGELFVSITNGEPKSIKINNDLLLKTTADINQREQNLLEFNLNKAVPQDPSI